MEKFLPIGSVVKIKGEKQLLMITSYCIFPNGKMFENGKEKEITAETMLEYGACTYPEGIMSSEVIYGFNHDQIEEICFLGYKTDSSDKLSDLLKENFTK